MNASRQSGFNVESLEQLTFERCKTWSKMLNTMSERSNVEELALSDFSAVFPSECDDDSDEEGGGDSQHSDEADVLDVFEDEEVLADITNRSRAMAKCQRTALDALPEAENGSKDGDDDMEAGSMQALLDQTMPVLNEHKRKWQESGLERVLNTFDVQKIEEKVGGWLRRNQSGVSGGARYVSFAECCTPAAGAHAHKTDSESDDSLHSVDMARYIRSSRKHKRTGGATSSSCTTTMTIKTFRLVQNKRAALREKQASCASDEAHLNELRWRRAQRCRAAGAAVDAGSASELLRLAPASRCIQRRERRKRLHKRRTSMTTHSSSYSSHSASSSTASSESSASSACCARRRKLSRVRERVHCRSAQKCAHIRSKRQQHHQTNSFSNSSSSFISTRSLRHIGRKLERLAAAGAEDMRPCKRESECRCCNDAKLCKEIRHLADTSTEDWLVENCDTPKKAWPHVGRLEQHTQIKVPKFKLIPEAAAEQAFMQQQLGKVSKQKVTKREITRENFNQEKTTPLKKVSKKIKVNVEVSKQKAAKGPTSFKYVPEEENVTDEVSKQKVTKRVVTQDNFNGDKPTSFKQVPEEIKFNEEVFKQKAYKRKAILENLNEEKLTLEHIPEVRKATLENFNEERQKVTKRQVTQEHSIGEKPTLKCISEQGIANEKFSKQEASKRVVTRDNFNGDKPNSITYVPEEENVTDEISKQKVNGDKPTFKHVPEEIKFNEEVSKQKKAVKRKATLEIFNDEKLTLEHIPEVRKATTEHSKKEKQTLEHIPEVRKDTQEDIKQKVTKRQATQEHSTGEKPTFKYNISEEEIANEKISKLKPTKRVATRDNFNVDKTTSFKRIPEEEKVTEVDSKQKATKRAVTRNNFIGDKPTREHISEEAKVNKGKDLPKLSIQKDSEKEKELAASTSTAGLNIKPTTELLRKKEKPKLLVASSKTSQNTPADAISISTDDSCGQELQSMDDSCEKELQLAIEISRKTFEQEQKLLLQQQKKMTVGKPKSLKRLNPKTERAELNKKGEHRAALKCVPKTKITNAVPNPKAPLLSSDDEENHKIQEIKLKENKLEERKVENNAEDDDASSSPEKTLKPQPKSVKLRKLAKMSQSRSQSLKAPSTEDTFFTDIRNLCNSTALAQDADAAQRQVSNEPNEQASAKPRQPEVRKNIKRMAAVSSTNRTGGSTAACSHTNPARDSNDCTEVSSTTDDPQPIRPPPMAVRSHRGILLYTPEQRTLAPVESFIDGHFKITEEHMSAIIGAKAARKFLKYYIGRRCFNPNSTVYFQPPPADAALDPNADTESDEDALECIGRYGALHESLNSGVAPR